MSVAWIDGTTGAIRTLGETLATTLIGLATRIAAKISAYTYAFLVNRLLGRPQGRSRCCGPEILATLIQRRLQFLGLLEVAVRTRFVGKLPQLF